MLSKYSRTLMFLRKFENFKIFQNLKDELKIFTIKNVKKIFKKKNLKMLEN